MPRSGLAGRARLAGRAGGTGRRSGGRAGRACGAGFHFSTLSSCCREYCHEPVVSLFTTTLFEALFPALPWTFAAVSCLVHTVCTT